MINSGTIYKLIDQIDPDRWKLALEILFILRQSYKIFIFKINIHLYKNTNRNLRNVIYKS